MLLVDAVTKRYDGFVLPALAGFFVVIGLALTAVARSRRGGL